MKIAYKNKMTNSSRTSRGPVILMPGPGTGRGPAVEKHCCRGHLQVML